MTLKYRHLYRKKRAFTLLELIFVIVVLGIVASIGSSLIANVYESYIVQRALHRSSSKAELAVQQIANRLSRRISPSVIGKKLNGTYLPIVSLPPGTTEYRILEWIGADDDGFNYYDIATQKAGWSGFCDIDNPATTRSNLVTQGSKLTSLDTIYTELGGAGIADAAIIFNSLAYAPSKNYAAACMGFTDDTCITEVTGILNDTNITTEDKGSAVTISDQYKLLRSAYAIVPTDNGDGTFDLQLYYNYQPWKGEDYANNGTPSTLVTNVTVFKFKGEKEGDTVRFKLCTLERIGDHNITSCKEKAVIR